MRRVQRDGAGVPVSTVTIFCRDGACNVETHTRDNCRNRYEATNQPRTTTAQLTPATLFGPCVHCGEFAYRTHLEGTTSHSDTGEPAC